jgi:subtilisin family serine protease
MTKDRFTTLLGTLARVVDPGVVWASGGKGNDNENDNGNGNENENGNTNENGNENDNGNDNGNENENENENDNGNDNGHGNHNDNDNHNGNDNDNGDGGAQQTVSDEVVVELEPSASAEAVAQRHGLSVVERLEGTNIFRMGFSSGLTVEQVLAELATDPDVTMSEPHYILEPPEISPGIDPRTIFFIDPRTIFFIDGSSPGDYFDQQSVARIRAEEAHSLSRGKGVTVAVIDTGVDFTHPALHGHIASDGYDFVQNDSDPSESCPPNSKEAPGCGHGTFIAGIIALVAPEATILPIRAFDPRGRSTTFDIAKAVDYAVSNGAAIINMSFGMERRSFVIDYVLRSAYSEGVLLLASAGNKNVDSKKNPQYPAADDSWVIAVAATDAHDLKADFSNFGVRIDVSAPGVGIYSAYPGGRFGTWSGTSFSTPFVSGEAALLYSTALSGGRGQRQVDPKVVWAAIEASAVNIDQSNPQFAGKLGKGRIDVFEAVKRIARQRSSQSSQHGLAKDAFGVIKTISGPPIQ